MVKVAVNGAVADNVPVPRATVASKNVTVPVGLPVPEVTVTVAVKVTDCPKTDGLVPDTTVVIVLPLAAGLTV